jgi:cbb3-type cytochrome c oxidase subunit III
VLRALGVALVCLAALAAAACGSEARVEEGEASAAAGKQPFVEQCGSCHTLADAGTQGTIGPNLDDAYGVLRTDHGFDESTIRDVVRGQIAYPTSDPPTVEEGGEPTQGMPANLVTGKTANDVAAYVASVAGLPVEGGGDETTGGEAADAKTIFTQQCGSCHVLADAGTNGTIGPNLDQARPGLEAAIRQVRNGGGGMPAFGDQLSDEQIRAVSQYVVENAGK